MRLLKHRALALMALSVLVAALLGASLGFAFGNSQTLKVGPDAVQGPADSGVSPSAWASCLPSDSWSAIYVWDTSTQRWSHFFNPDLGVPGYANNKANGGILVIPEASGVTIVMTRTVDGAQLADSPGQACG